MRRAVAIVGLAGCLIGCGSPPPSDRRFELVTGPGPSPGQSGACSLGWWTAGQLVVDPRGGTSIIVDSGDFAHVGDWMPVHWWPGFTGRRVGNEVEVLDPDGSLVATTGHRYRIEAAFPFDAGFVACGDDVTALPTAAVVSV